MKEEAMLVRRKQNILVRIALLGLLSGSLAGCVTESTGGKTLPAPDAERVSAQLDLARAYLERRDWTRAKAPLGRALDIDSNSVEANVLSAVLFTEENEPELAEKHYRKALSVAPDNAQALNNYASFLYAQARYEDALIPLKTLVSNTRYRARPQAFESLGLAQLQAGDRTSTESALRRALQLNPRLPRSNLELAEIEFAGGDIAAAQTYFVFFTRLSRPNPRNLCLGIKLAKAQNNSDQEAYLSFALKNLFPDAVEQCQT
jgi:type IV pilus assembly protein PilF